MRIALCAVLALFANALPAQSQQKGATAIPVGIVNAERKPVARQAEFVGRVEAIDRVEIRARVTGYLEAVNFKEGDVGQGGRRRSIASKRDCSRPRSSRQKAHSSGARPRRS